MPKLSLISAQESRMRNWRLPMIEREWAGGAKRFDRTFGDGVLDRLLVEVV
jgi:hypothetical protein